MTKLSLLRSVVTASLLGATTLASAQVFNPSPAAQAIYPTGTLIQRPTTVSNYSFRNVATGWGTADIYLSGFSGATNGFVWRLNAAGSPTAIFAQNTVAYSNVMDMEVGLVDVSGTKYLLVAYYKIGSGHFVDTYKLTTSTATPVVFGGTMMLSSSANYGRIRIDSHKSYGIAIAWANPGVGIQTIVANNGTWGGIVTLAGTTKCEDPDVAFSHSSGPLNVHFAYHDKSNLNIVESVMDWSVLLGSSGTLAPTIEDVNFVGTQNSLRVVLDCPDHYDVENWAYTYTTNNAEISVRFIDYHSTATPTTAVINNGSLGNASMLGSYKSFQPALHYNNGYNGEQIQVGWYFTNGGATNGYVGMHVNESLTGFLNTPDYYLLPNANTSSIYPLRPGIAYSKASDVGGIAPNFMYACFYDLVSGTYRFHHAFHPWGSPVFKGTNANYHPECGEEHSMAALTDNVRVYPNPFNDVATAMFTVKDAGKVNLQLVDITGRIVDQTTTEVSAGTHTFTTSSLKGIPAGIYQLNVMMNGTRVATEKVVKN